MVAKSKLKIIFSLFSPESDIYEFKNVRSANYIFHQHFYNTYAFDKHIILSTNELSTQASRYIQLLQNNFASSNIQLETLDENSEFLIKNVEKLQNCLSRVFEKYKQHDIYYLFNPGFGLVKYIIKELEQPYRIKILFLDFSKNTDKPSLIELNTHQINATIEKAFKTEIIADVDILKPIFDQARMVAQSDESVIILGETGTGKELLARYIYVNSLRNNKPFETVNCSAFRPELLESRLFGHKKGSFTDAHEDRKGLFEEANGGTVFLDEIGDIDPYMQQLLLRFLQFKEIQPIGKKSKKVDVRIIAATNKDLLQEVKAQRFRTDLFYRMGFFLHLPPIRNYSKEDKIKVFKHFIDVIRISTKKEKSIILSDELTEFLLNYPFPGNYREIELIFKHLYVFAKNEYATIDDLPKFILQNNNHDGLFNSSVNNWLTLDNMISLYCQKAYEAHHKNLSKTAKTLKISLNTLKKYLNYE